MACAPSVIGRIVGLVVVLGVVPGPLAAQTTPLITCSPFELANGACIDVLTREPSDPRTYSEMRHLEVSDTDYVLAGVARDGLYPASSGGMRLPVGYLPGRTELDAYVAKYSTDDAVAEWVVPLADSYVFALLRGPAGRIYVLASTLSARFPLPPLTAVDREALGDRADSYEARLRHHYLPAGEGRGGFGRENEPGMSLTYEFKTRLFWIVSRTNNCLY